MRDEFCQRRQSSSDRRTRQKRTFRTAGSHDERCVVPAQLGHTNLSDLVTDARQVTRDHRLERLLDVGTGLALELAPSGEVDVFVRLLVRVLDESVLLRLELLAGRDVADPDREPFVGEPARAQFRHPVHALGRFVGAKVALDDGKHALLVAVADRRLVEHARDDLRVLDDEEPVVDRHEERVREVLFLRPLGRRLLERLVLALEVDVDRRVLVRPHQDAEHLLAGPEAFRFQDGRRGQFDLELGVLQVRAHLRKLLPVEEGVFSSDEVAPGDEVLRRGDDRFSVSRRDQVALDVHQLERLGTRFFRLRDVCAKDRDDL